MFDWRRGPSTRRYQAGQSPTVSPRILRQRRAGDQQKSSLNRGLPVLMAWIGVLPRFSSAGERPRQCSHFAPSGAICYTSTTSKIQRLSSSTGFHERPPRPCGTRRQSLTRLNAGSDNSLSEMTDTSHPLNGGTTCALRPQTATSRDTGTPEFLPCAKQA